MWSLTQCSSTTLRARCGDDRPHAPPPCSPPPADPSPGRGRRRSWYGYTGATAAKYFLSVLIGVFVGGLAFGIERATVALVGAKLAWLDALAPTDLAPAAAAVAGCSLLAALAAGLLVQFVAPAAAGGGVTPIMAFLNGTHIRHLLSVRTLSVKSVGCVLAVASGLAVGPEGKPACASARTHTRLFHLFIIVTFPRETQAPSCTSAPPPPPP